MFKVGDKVVCNKIWGGNGSPCVREYRYIPMVGERVIVTEVMRPAYGSHCSVRSEDGLPIIEPIFKFKSLDGQHSNWFWPVCFFSAGPPNGISSHINGLYKQKENEWVKISKI